jgi:hypothetical protein
MFSTHLQISIDTKTGCSPVRNLPAAEPPSSRLFAATLGERCTVLTADRRYLGRHESGTDTPDPIEDVSGVRVLQMLA